MRGEDGLEGTRDLPFNEIWNGELSHSYLTSYIALNIVTKDKTLLFLLVVLGFLASPVLFSFLSFLLAEKRGGKRWQFDANMSLTDSQPPFSER